MNHEPFPRRLARRAVTVPAYMGAAAGLLVLTPALLPAAAAVDLIRGRGFVLVRCLLMGLLYFLAETVGVIASLWIWLTSAGWHGTSQRFLDRNFALQCRWAATLFWGGVRIFGLRLRIEGDEVAVPGPVLVFVRHASPVDNLIPAVLASKRHGLRLRWVINRSLLRDPCLDIVGGRLPNAFVSGDTLEGARYRAAVSGLGRGLGSEDGVLIYPEGALFNPARRERVVERLRGTLYGERAAALRHVLPPRPGGALGLLEAAQGADVVFCAHTGLEPAGSYRSFLSGTVVGAEVRIRFWRVAAAAIPDTDEERMDWLYDQWANVDRWIATGERRPEAGAPEPVGSRL